jgi:hypothetical protein
MAFTITGASVMIAKLADLQLLSLEAKVDS